MGNDLVQFDFEGRKLRTVIRDGECWWALADICQTLNIANSRMTARSLDEDEKGVSSIDTPGGRQEITVVNESGLYTIILRSREATTPGTLPHRFRKWVTGVVLPTIRKAGRYEVAAKPEKPKLTDDLRAAINRRSHELGMVAARTIKLRITDEVRRRLNAGEEVSEELIERLTPNALIESYGEKQGLEPKALSMRPNAVHKRAQRERDKRRQARLF